MFPGSPPGFVPAFCQDACRVASERYRLGWCQPRSRGVGLCEGPTQLRVFSQERTEMVGNPLDRRGVSYPEEVSRGVRFGSHLHLNKGEEHVGVRIVTPVKEENVSTRETCEIVLRVERRRSNPAESVIRDYSRQSFARLVAAQENKACRGNQRSWV